MNQAWQSTVSFPFMDIMAILFLIVFGMVVRYLIFVLKLLNQVKTAEPDLWVSLGKPAMFRISFTPSRQIEDLLSLIRFIIWFLKGGKGAAIPKTMAMVEKTRRLFIITTIGMAILFFCVTLFL